MVVLVGGAPVIGPARAEKRVSSVSQLLAARAFAQGFVVGAEARATGRTVVDAATHEHWRAGFSAGRRAAEYAERNYLAALRSA